MSSNLRIVLISGLWSFVQVWKRVLYLVNIHLGFEQREFYMKKLGKNFF
ncbi:hypothetical protein LEP1GSC082_1959 [Leptospira kirschneri str. H2]|uniref:Uncharacterized protein n=1 Tax=Leptospira kirschneri str. H1 TaxID=1049966 RepID=A0A0E2AYG8_9LEPT|nr:hypothetical protein LEP1GSC081_0241 [Leptospira kirschneri str. H1]EKO58631.1 hypothetical protein LEP1GSC082_1959 [Leptospira kirschneri str. H2]